MHLKINLVSFLLNIYCVVDVWCLCKIIMHTFLCFRSKHHNKSPLFKICVNYDRCFVVNYSNKTIADCCSISNDILYRLTKSAIPDFTKKRPKKRELERRGWWCDLWLKTFFITWLFTKTLLHSSDSTY